MAKKLYGSTGGLSNEVIKMYASVGGLSSNITKAYCSIGGLSKLFFGSGGGGEYSGFWFYYSTLAENIIQGKRYTVVPNQVQVDINKRANGIAFYFFIQQVEAGSIIENLIITVSTDNTATPYNAVCQGQTETYTNLNNVTINNITWYYTVGTPVDYDYNPTSPTDITPNCIVNNETIASLYNVEDIVKGFINNYIYTNDFAYNYQVGQTYPLMLGNKEKTLRKAIAVALYKSVSLKDTTRFRDGYAYWLNHVDEMVAEALTRLEGYNAIHVSVEFSSGTDTRCLFIKAGNVTSPFSIRITSRQQNDGYDWVSFENASTGGYIQVKKQFRAQLSVSGTLSWIDMTPSGSIYNIGTYGMAGAGEVSNIGLQFEKKPIAAKTVYYSNGVNEYVLNKSTSTWVNKTWNFPESFSPNHFVGYYIWTDGTNTYYSQYGAQYVLNQATDTWEPKTWNGARPDYGIYVWTDGTNIYYKENSTNRILDKATSTWSSVTFNGTNNFTATSIWTDGENVYSSFSTNQYVLDKATRTWNAKTWNGLSNIDGSNIWTDGDNIYYSYSYSSGSSTVFAHYVLNKATSTWSTKTWLGNTNFTGGNIWTDGYSVFSSSSGWGQYVLDTTTSTWTRIPVSTEWPNVDAFYIWQA